MKPKERYLSVTVKEDLSEKMVFIGGPRQVGKTTVAKELIGANFKTEYFNWDKFEQRKKALRGEWDANAELIILDEFHKHQKWKSWIKGEYDIYKQKYKFLLTGSSHLNIYRKGGDSLQGRYHYYTLFPFTCAELDGLLPITQMEPGQELDFKSDINDSVLNALLTYGGFPEPMIKQNHKFHRRWSNEYVDRFFKEDIRELTAIKDFGSLTLLTQLLPEKVASIISVNSLANDLQVNFRTVSHWLDVFEQFYYCFRLSPFQTKKVASVRKEKKIYLWDWSTIEEEGARIENFVALHLLKYCSYLYESEGWNVALMYLRDSSGREVDFLVTYKNKPWFAVEVKNKDKNLSKNLLYFKKKLDIPFSYQVVQHLKKDFMKNNIRIMPLKRFLTALI